jgi:hypothetical protein
MDLHGIWGELEFLALVNSYQYFTIFNHLNKISAKYLGSTSFVNYPERIEPEVYGLCLHHITEGGPYWQI